MLILPVLRSAAIFVSFSLAPVPMFAAAPSTSGAETTARHYSQPRRARRASSSSPPGDDLWTVSLNGGTAERLTTAPGTETMASISPDGKTVAFLADYEGPERVYTMPIWRPARAPHLGRRCRARRMGSRTGRLMIATSRYSTLPGTARPRRCAGQARDRPLAEAAGGRRGPPTATPSSSRAGSGSGARPSATRVAGLRTSGRFDGHGEAFPSPPTTTAPPRTHVRQRPRLLPLRSRWRDERRGP